jgi:uncharacterized protein
LKAVFDTNIYISAFAIPGGNAEKAYLKAINGDFELFTSVAILTELANVLCKKFGWENHKVEQLLGHISNLVTVFKTKPYLKTVPYEPDSRILECALKAKADFVITGDKHLLKLGKYKNIKIISLSVFLKCLGKNAPEITN